MPLFTLIPDEKALESEKSRLLQYLADELSITFKSERRRHEVVAKLLGAKDWNTLIGIVRKKTSEVVVVREPVRVGEFITTYLHGRFGIRAYEVISELIEAMDECVFNRYGDAKWVSDKINNQGLDVQLNHLANDSVPVLTSETIKLLLSEDVWDAFKSIANVSPEEIGAYINNEQHVYGLCTRCGHVRQSGGFCQRVGCPNYLINANHEKRLTVKMIARPDHTDIEFEFDASDYFFNLRRRSPRVISNVMESLTHNMFSASTVTDNILYELERDKLTLSKAKNFFLRDMHQDGFYCEIVEIDNMKTIMGGG